MLRGLSNSACGLRSKTFYVSTYLERASVLALSFFRRCCWQRRSLTAGSCSGDGRLEFLQFLLGTTPVAKGRRNSPACLTTC